VLYFGLTTFLWNGRTVGKRLFGIRVVSLVHERMSLWHSIERALGYGAAALEFGFGFLQFFIHPSRRTAQDRVRDSAYNRLCCRAYCSASMAAPRAPAVSPLGMM
jgi:uncharacterized RDD family membrane protein YckC